MRTILRLHVVLLLTLSSQGCMSLYGTFSDQDPPPNNRIYIGVRYGIEILREGVVSGVPGISPYVVLIDLPFSFVADTVLLPYTCIDALIHAGQPRKSKRRAEYEAYVRERNAIYEQLNRDPEVVLREGWYSTNEKWYSTNDVRKRAFIDSLSLRDATIPYSLDFLKRLYDEAPGTRDALFAHPACDAEFLANHFEEAYRRALSLNPKMLEAIVSNPATPEELVRKVADARDLPGSAIDEAHWAIERRRAMQNR